MDANVGQLFIPVVEKAHFESFCGIPVKQIRDSAITRVDMKDSKLGPCGGVILAHCLKSNSSVTVVEASNCGMGTAGAKAFGDALRVNKTLQHLNVSNNSFCRPVVGDTVRLKVNGEVKTVTKTSNDGVHVESSLSSEGYVAGYFVDADYEWESQVPAFCAGLAASSSLLSVSDSVWCNGRLLRPCGGA